MPAEKVEDTQATEAASPVDDESDLSHLTDDHVEPAETTEAPAKEAAVTETPVVELPKSRHPSGLRRRALAYGATQEQIDAVSLDDLDAWVDEQEQFREQEQATKKKPVVAEEDAIDWGKHEDGTPVTEAEITPGLVKAHKALLNRQKATEAKVAAQEHREATRQQLSVNEACDSAIESLGPKYEKAFGKGDMRDLAKGSKEAKRRVAAYRDAGIDINLDSPAAIARKLKRSANALFEDLIAEPKKADDNLYDAETEPEKPNGVKRFTKEEWEAGAVATPTNKRPKPLKGEAAAREAVRAYFRENNIADGSEEDQFAGVPK